MDQFVEVIDKRNYVLHCKFPSYVKVFVKNLEEGGYFVHKTREPKKSSSSIRNGSSSDYSDYSDLDLTGSPLKFSYYNIKCDDTVVVQQTDWLTDEENHVSLSLQEASKLLSQYNLKKLASETKPLWVVCNGQDTQNTMLMATCKKEGWCTRTIVKFSGLYASNSREMDPTYMQEQHAHFTEGLLRASPEANCRYVICRSSATQNLGLDSSIIESNLKVEVDLSWNSASLKPLTNDITANLMVQVNAGHCSSGMLKLWQEMCLLQQLLEARSVAKAERNQPVLQRNVIQDGGVSIREQVLEVLHGISKYQPPWCEVQTKRKEEMVELDEVVRKVVEASPETHELTHRLWLVLSGCSDIAELMDCLELVFNEVRSHQSRPFVLPSNHTSVAEVILKLMNDEPTSIEMTGIVALEYLIEMGIEKLTQDYNTIFVEAGLACKEDQKVAMPANDSSCRFERSLTWLARLHSTLEVLLPVQTHFNFSQASLCSLAVQVIGSCTQNVQSFALLRRSPLLSLVLSASFKDLKDRLPNQFSRWSLTLKATSESSGVTSMFVCSSSFIFPPGVYTWDGTVNGEVEAQYYLFKLTSWSDKIPF